MTGQEFKPGVITPDSSNICVYCHTPHGTDETVRLPRWNRNVDQAKTYATFDTLGRNSMGRRDIVGTVSMACMSCHDGMQAMNITSLSMDHPFGIPYRGYFPKETPPQVMLGPETTDAPFKKPSGLAAPNFRIPSSAVIDEEPVWWIETGAPGRQRSDIKLFSRLSKNDEPVPYVECASCHDPHSDQRTFLRISNDGSKLCFSCHEDK